MTATITSIAQGFDDGARIYCFHGRTSTVAAGSLWTAAAAWWFVSQAGTVTKRHHGLELIHCSTYNGERIDFLLVDEDGTAEWATNTTTSVGSTFAYTCWVSDAANGGSDSNDGLSAGSPKLTIAAANTLVRAAWSSGAEHRIIMKGALTSTSPTGGAVWNGTDSASGGTALSGRLHWVADGTASMTVTGGSAVSFSGADHGFHNEGVNIIGPYTLGGADPGFLYGISRGLSSSGGGGMNVSARNCTIEGWETAVVTPTTAVAITEMGNGAFDFWAFDTVTFGACYSSHVYTDQLRYVGWANCAWQELNGSGTGYGWRFQQTSYWSVTDCTMDRTDSPSWRANLFRLNGGFGTSAWDRCQYGSVHNLAIANTTEAIELEMPVDEGDRYVADVWFHAVSWDCAASPISHMFQIVNTTGDSWDITRIRITNCSGRGSASPTYFLRIAQHSATTTAKLNSLRVDQNTWYQEQSQGFFSRDAVFCYATGDATNFVDDSLEFLSNYAFCADTDANSPRCFWVIPSASAKVGASDYNVLGSAGTNTTTWNDADSLATWQGATAFDDNSFEITSASHNLTTVTALSFNPEPAADGTPSASLPQVRRGMPGLGYADADRYLRDASLPDAGSHEYGSGTLLSDPSFMSVIALETLLALIDSRNNISVNNVTLSGA